MGLGVKGSHLQQSNNRCRNMGKILKSVLLEQTKIEGVI